MSSEKKEKVIIVSGPTGSGKSGLALNLAKEFSAYLISADSRQVYKQMSIGTNKDKGQWQEGKYLVEGVEEFLVDIIKPKQEFSLAQWLNSAREIINSKTKLPIVVGGTGLYIFALAQGYELPGKSIGKLRKKLENKLEKKGLPYLIKKLKKLDPEIENKIDIHNPRRVIRAYEICLTGKKEFNPQKGFVDYDVLHLAVKIDRAKLYEKINKRVDQMVEQGLVDEIKFLIKKYNKKLPAFSGIGYRQIIQYLEGEISLEKAIELVKRDTRRYAKRQLTWLKTDKSIVWVENYEQAKRLVKNFLKK